MTSTTWAASAAAAGGGGGGGRGGGGRGGGGFGGFGGGGEPTVRDRGAAGFGVRVIHSGVWGFASSPIVTEDEIKRITRPGDRGRQGQRDRQARRREARAGDRPTRSTGRRPSRRIPATVSQEEKQALVQKVVDLVVEDEGGHERQRLGAARARVEVLRQQRGLLHRAGDLDDDAAIHRDGAEGG